MRTTTMALTAFLFGIGCSHAQPKPEAPAPVASAPRPAPPRAPAEEHTEAQASNRDSGNAIFFDFDSAVIRQDAQPTLQELGERLLHSKKKIQIQGNCDERGTTEYNLALGDRRAREARRYLERLGVPKREIGVVSYGSERPKALGHDESAWAENRRDDLVVE